MPGTHKDYASAHKYASEKVKSHRDSLDGIELWKHKDSSFSVNHTMNTQGRMALKKQGAVHHKTVYKERKKKIREETKGKTLKQFLSGLETNENS